MKHLMLSIAIALLSATMVAPDVQAKRLGGGGSAGMKRDMPSRSTPDSTPAQQAPKQPAANPAQQNAAPAAATTGAAAATASKRSWMGPIAGLAAGLGIAALMSHLGLGEAFGNIVMLVLLGVVALVLVRWAMRRFGPRLSAQQTPQGLKFAAAGVPDAVGPGELATQRSLLESDGNAHRSGAGPLAAVSQPLEQRDGAPRVPPGFDTAAFERIAKLIFIRMQAANDAGDAQDLRRFTTPEMFAAVHLDLQDRRAATQHTDVVQLDAQVLDCAEEHGQQVVSVRFHGLIREERDAPAAPFDEVWHLVKPLDGSREWAIAGIAQTN